jgi:hypothetical protein
MAPRRCALESGRLRCGKGRVYALKERLLDATPKEGTGHCERAAPDRSDCPLPTPSGAPRDSGQAGE